MEKESSENLKFEGRPFTSIFVSYERRSVPSNLSVYCCRDLFPANHIHYSADMLGNVK